ncbi:hypothetical protein BBJ28_00019496 [Nothophytophthora sp. Chile5]|nr:hypothetical protein BBJ28_00019496 [Nothophytophthora sp. Chile5]
MPPIATDTAEVLVGALGCLSLGIGIAALTISSLVASAALTVLIGGCAVICLAGLLWALRGKRRAVGLTLSVLLLACCVATVAWGLHLRAEADSQYGSYVYVDVGEHIGIALGLTGGCVALEVAIALLLWTRRSKRPHNPDKLDSPVIVEVANAPSPGGAGYEAQLSPVGELKTSAIPSRTSSTKSSSSRDGKKRPQSLAGLWNDEAITAARVPKEKVAIDELICRGGYGEVYVGSFNGLAVAVKMLLPATRKSIRHVNDFLAEVKLMASLDHPCIVQFVGVAWDSLTDLCVLTEYMEGGDLRDLLQTFDSEQHPVGFNSEKVRIALDVANALTYLHSLAPVVIHRDLKSKNILLSDELDAKLTDFGVSRERVDRTMTAGVGTSLWMAPEVLMGERYDDKADVFSFGVVLSELDLQTLPYSHAVESDGSGRRMRDTAVLQQVAMGKLRVQFSAGALKSMVDLGNACVSLNPTERPTAAEALYKLQMIRREDAPYT